MHRDGTIIFAELCPAAKITLGKATPFPRSFRFVDVIRASPSASTEQIVLRRSGRIVANPDITPFWSSVRIGGDSGGVDAFCSAPRNEMPS